MSLFGIGRRYRRGFRRSFSGGLNKFRRTTRFWRKSVKWRYGV